MLTLRAKSRQRVPLPFPILSRRVFLSIFLFLVHRILAKKKAASETREPLEGQDSTVGCSRFFLEIQPDNLHFQEITLQTFIHFKASKITHQQRVAGSSYAKIFSQILFKSPSFSSSKVQNEVQTFPPKIPAHVFISFARFSCSRSSTATAARACSTCSKRGTLSRSAQ